MTRSIRKIAVIGQKEFADSLWSPVFLLLLLTFTLVIFFASYWQGMLGEHLGRITAGPSSVLMLGFKNLADIMAWFTPLIGIALSFNAVINEQRSGSLNVLLGHPVFRDNIILGKVFGALLTTAIVLFISTAVSAGTLLMFFGVTVTAAELVRIALYVIITFLYTSVFIGIGFISSIKLKDASDSLIYNIVIWLCLSIVFTVIVNAIYLLIEHTLVGNPDSWNVIGGISNISPMHHYAELITGRANLGWSGPGVESTIKGVIDTRFTIFQWLNEFWTNLVVLIATPIILFVISFISFLRRDITL